MSFLTVLPLAVVMVAGPQIVSAVLLATGERAKRASTAYLAGVALAIAIGLSAFHFVVQAVIGSSSRGLHGIVRTVIDWLVLAAIPVLLVLLYRGRNRTEPPGWMGKVETASPGFAFRLGFLLFLLMPTDILTMGVVAASLARHGPPLWHVGPFLLLTLVLVALPLLTLLVLTDRAVVLGPRIRDWMNVHSWIVGETVIVFHGLHVASSLAGY